LLNGKRVGPAGTLPVGNLAHTTSYDLVADGGYLQRHERLQVTVDGGDSAGGGRIVLSLPRISFFRLQPATSGSGKALAWQVVGAKTVTLDGKNVSATGQEPVLPGATTLLLLASNEVGTRQATLTVSGPTPTPRPSDTPSPTVTRAPSQTPVRTATPTPHHATQAPTRTPTPAPRRAPTHTATPTPRPPTRTATPRRPTATRTATPRRPTATRTPRPTFTLTPRPTFTPTNTDTPVPPTNTPTPVPTDTPTTVPPATATPLPLLQSQVPGAWTFYFCTPGGACRQAPYEMVTIINAGPGPVQGPITGAFTQGTDFTLVASKSTCTSAGGLAVGASCTFYVELGSPNQTYDAPPSCVFAPASDTLSVTAQAINSPLAVTISFNTICPTPTPTPVPANFQVTQPATWTYVQCVVSRLFRCPSPYGGYFTLDIQVLNTGPGTAVGPIHGNVISGNTADFLALPTSAASTCETNTSLGPKATCVLQVEYIGQGCPTAPESAVFEVTGDAANSPQDSTLNDPHACQIIG
jgi:hypothetical protein